MSNKELEPELKLLMETFIEGIQIEEQYLMKSQAELGSILQQCILKTEAINESGCVTQEKADLINEKLGRIPRLQARIEGLSRLFYDAHKRIEAINKNIGHLDKIEAIQAQHQRGTKPVDSQLQDKGSLQEDKSTQGPFFTKQDSNLH